MIIHYAIDTISITTCYHRHYSHRSFEMSRWMKFVLLLLSAGALQNSALVWCLDHRLHHRHVDTDKDPYNINRGFWWAHWLWMFFQKDGALNYNNIPNDLKSDRLLMWQHKYYLPLAMSVSFGLPTLAGYLIANDPLGGFIFGGLMRLVISSHCTFFINSVAHLIGNRPYCKKISAQDNAFLALFTMGEGYHNFHHKFENDYRNGIYWYQWDPTKWFIGLMSFFGISRKLKRTPEHQIILAKLDASKNELEKSGIDLSRLDEMRESIVFRLGKLRQLLDEKKELINQKRAHQIKNIQLSYHEPMRRLRAQIRLTRHQYKSMLRDYRFELRQIMLIQSTV